MRKFALVATVALTHLVFGSVGMAQRADQPLPSGPKAFVGSWRIGHDGEGSQTRVPALNAAGVIGGYQVRAPPY